MNAANDHMSEGVDPQADSCDPPHEKESQQILQIMVHKRWECCAHQSGSLEVINWLGPKLKPPTVIIVVYFAVFMSPFPPSFYSILSLFVLACVHTAGAEHFANLEEVKLDIHTEVTSWRRCQGSGTHTDTHAHRHTVLFNCM